MAVVCPERRRGLEMAAARSSRLLSRIDHAAARSICFLFVLLFEIVIAPFVSYAAEPPGQAHAGEGLRQEGPKKERKRSGSRKKTGEEKARSCWPGAPGTDPRLCPPNDPKWGGEWDFMSCIPPEVNRGRMHPREQELGSIGMSLDSAWQYTTGRDDVVIAVLDSGIRWDNTDLSKKIYLNRGELPLPENSSVYDKNRDGIFNVEDYAGDTRVVDANKNGQLDAEDLIAAFSDCQDNDGNGYPDDIAGYDLFSRSGHCGFEAGDNDPRDDTNFGHGTGIATTAAAETNNGIDNAGVCPRCRILPVRVGDSFVVDANQFARGVVFAVRSGATLIASALGSYNNTPAARAAVDLAYENGVPIIASAADEFSYHHNFPSVYNHALYVNSIRYNHANDYRKASTFWGVNPCTNFGARVWITVPAESCSSGSTSRLAGVAGLVESMARDAAVQNFQAEEVYQILRATADDLDNSTPDWGTLRYPAKAGFDQLYGYGRLNALKAVLAAKARRLPPLVDLGNPEWFAVISPQTTPTLPIGGTVRIPRAKQASWRLEYALGVEPREEEYRLVSQGTVTNLAGTASASGATSAASSSGATSMAKPSGGTSTASVLDGTAGVKEGLLGTLDFKSLPLPTGPAPRNRTERDRYSVTVRLRATDDQGLISEARRSFFVLDDPSWKTHAPLELGASGEAEPVLADLDGDGRDEIVLPTADGYLRILKWQAGGLRVQLAPLDDVPIIDPFPASRSPLSRPGAFRESAIRGAAVGDLFADGRKEIVVASREGKVYAFTASGERLHGFPVSVRRDLGSQATPRRPVESGILSRPVLADIDGKPGLEIVVAALDGHVYVWKNDGRLLGGFPVRLWSGRDGDAGASSRSKAVQDPGPRQAQEPARDLGEDQDESQGAKIVSTPAIGDIDGDGVPDIVVGSNAVRDELSAAYAIHADGNAHPGGAFLPGWSPFELPALRPHLLPTIASGVQMDPILVDVDGDGDKEVVLYAVTADTIVLVDQGRDGSPRILSRFSMEPGKESPYRGTTFLTGPGSPMLSDTDGDGEPELYAPLLPFRMLTLRMKPAVPLEASLVVGGWKLHASPDVARGARPDRESGSPAAKPTSSDPRVPMISNYPRSIEDLMILGKPVAADVDGDGVQEVLAGSGGYLLHAYRKGGGEAQGFPKFTGGWIFATPAVGDIDGDGRLDLVAVTREGYLFAWDLASAATARGSSARVSSVGSGGRAASSITR